MEMLTPREIADILKISYHKALDFIKYSGIDYIKVVEVVVEVLLQ